VNWKRGQDPWRDYKILLTGSCSGNILRWEGTFNYQVYAKTAQQSWIFRPKGLWQKRLVISEAENHQTIATFQRALNGSGILRFFDGRIFIYDNTSLRSGEWAWLNGESTPLVHFLKHSRVEIEPSANTMPELLLLIVFGFFLLKLADAEAVSASLEMVG